ncbi:hypothetical protein [Paenibacillus alginolyticus]|uniref:Tissue inhibitor of metalloproteinase n=1 Tax=Paenibacillus alginolyticus TaxID=59839 RepID=A0ABT4GL73_9BACL|nr:hypothetical protein [Paenibacillus alginolyticus]MCY9696959.1 hypothetical protein [Paenibacillus alginolyticus]MEC0143397.1 hypothetical protein [Paenibacillus alginolyticus]
MRKTILALFVICLFSFKLNEPVSALSCAPPKSIKEELANSTVVFMGTALNSNTAKYDLSVVFSVKTLWKGDTDIIEKGIFVGDMWKEIKAGQDYLIFASQREGHLEANLCGNSKLWSEVSQEQIKICEKIKSRLPNYELEGGSSICENSKEYRPAWFHLMLRI